MTSEPVRDAIAAATEFARPAKTGGTCRRRNDQPSGRKGNRSAAGRHFVHGGVENLPDRGVQLRMKLLAGLLVG